MWEGARQSWRDQPVISLAQVRSSKPPGSECCVRRRLRRTRSVHSCCVGCGSEPRNDEIAGAEIVFMVERNMRNAVMRGIVVPPGSRATSRAKGSRRNLGYLVSGRQALRERDGPHREGEEPKPMMHGREKSDPVIVAMKPANKAKEAHCGGICGGGRSGVGGAK